jgi:hypothetical protein
VCTRIAANESRVQHLVRLGVEYTNNLPASVRDISAWEKDNHPYGLSEDIKSFLQVSNGLLLKWKIKHQG